MYLWLLCSALREQNSETYVQHVPSQDDWLSVFPSLAELTTPKLRLTDRASHRLGQGYGRDYSREDLSSFIRTYILSSKSFHGRLVRAARNLDESTLTINVRRGDYYGTRFEPEFGMNVAAYVQEALSLQESLGRISRIQFVSDDLAWCRSHLQDAASKHATSWKRLGPDPFDDLATLAASTRLILANSTFSYWGAYIASEIHGTAQRTVAPAFHSTQFAERIPWFHDPKWQLIHEIPGGWQPPATTTAPVSLSQQRPRLEP